eukprot:TRINITY_DN627_c0_g2_i4.p1 TRINITY_DN627_c0_g2~~TRINITY_DN627_c0_g2_i4.p1  ORF type:complete len:101 (-),score=13.73 TRINITY_DN627_c0_g2_i4:602-904(-)
MGCRTSKEYKGYIVGRTPPIGRAASKARAPLQPSWDGASVQIVSQSEDDHRLGFGFLETVLVRQYGGEARNRAKVGNNFFGDKKIGQEIKRTNLGDDDVW